MKSFFRTIAALITLLAAVSCKLDFLYVSLPNTSWVYELNDQKAFVHFSPNGRATIMQYNYGNNAVQFTNGTYTASGHAVDVLGDDGTSHRLIRTFSHLKNSKSKNFSTYRPQDCQSLENCVWTSIKQDNFRLIYCMADGRAKEATFSNVNHAEGIPYGWEQTSALYSATGSYVAIGREGGVLFPELMLLDDVWFMHLPVGGDQGTSAVKGSLWTYQSSGYPGIIVFDTNSSFTRVLLGSRVLYQVSRGTYSQNGNVLTMTLDGKTESCEIKGDKFTFLGKTYSLFE